MALPFANGREPYQFSADAPDRSAYHFQMQLRPLLRMPNAFKPPPKWKLRGPRDERSAS